MLDIIAASDRAGQQLLEELLSSLSPEYSHAVAMKAVDDYAHVARVACAEVLAGR
jgi:hypothetical protein